MQGAGILEPPFGQVVREASLRGREGGALLGRGQGQLGVFETETEIEIEAETEGGGQESEGRDDKGPEV